MPHAIIDTRLRTARFPSLEQRVNKPELLDQQGFDASELRHNLRDIRRVNRLFGGTAAVMRHLPQLVTTVPCDQPISILDLATGSADIPLEISAWARLAGRTVSICASDARAEILEIARENAAHDPAIYFAAHDATAVDMPGQWFDIVLCSLALHHFDPGQAIMVLREMERLSRVGFILNDLRRSGLGFASTWVASRATTRNRLTRHDAPLSIQRAYTPAELRWLLHKSGSSNARIFTAPWFRMTAVRSKLG